MKLNAGEYFEKKYFIFFLFIFFSLVTVALFYSSFNNYFLADDYWYLLKISRRSWFFCLTQFYSHFDPVPVLFNKIIFSVWGLSPAPYRLLLFLGHAFSSALVYKICIELFGFFSNDSNLSNIHERSLICAVVFFIMHIHTENIIYINGHHEMLFSVFFLVSFYFYLVYKRDHKLKDKVLLNIFLILSLLSKENAVIFLPLIILIEILFFHDKLIQVLKNYYSIGVIIFLYLLLRILIYDNEKFGISYGIHFPGIISETFKNIFFALTAFIFSLNFIQIKEIYRSANFNIFDTFGNLAGQYPLSVIAIIFTILIYILIIIKRDKTVKFGFVFFIVTISPFIWLAVYERYLYLPSLGFAVIAGWFLGKLYFRNKQAYKYWGVIFLCIFIIYNVYSMGKKKENYEIASGLALNGINEIIRVSSALPLNAEVYFRNLPDNYNGAWIFRDGVQYFPELYLNRKDMKFNRIFEEDIHTDANRNIFVFNLANGKLYLEN